MAHSLYNSFRYDKNPRPFSEGLELKPRDTEEFREFNRHHEVMAELTCISMPYGLSCSIESMSSPAAEFVESWIDQNVTYVDKGGDYVWATTLADMCREAAAAIGVSISEIKPEFGTLESIILEAMHHAIGTPDD